MVDEIFQFEDKDGNVVKIKKIISPSVTVWQIFNPDSKKWLVKSESVVMKLYKELLVQDRNVLIEKKYES